MALEVFAEPVVEKADVFFGAFEADGADEAPVAVVDGEQVFGGWGLVGLEPLSPVFVVLVEVGQVTEFGDGGVGVLPEKVVFVVALQRGED